MNLCSSLECRRVPVSEFYQRIYTQNESQQNSCLTSLGTFVHHDNAPHMQLPLVSSNLPNTLESIQNQAVRLIPSNYECTASVSATKASLCNPTTSTRRRILCLCLLHKIFYHRPQLGQSWLLDLHHSSR